jgi:hypothetical protein
MTFKEALKKLNIEDYGERIFNSNSYGELFHCADYIKIAQEYEDTSWFRDWFLDVVKWAEDNWKRPQSVYQHILKILIESYEDVNENKKDNKTNS